MKVKDIKKVIEKLPDDTEIVIRNRVKYIQYHIEGKPTVEEFNVDKNIELVVTTKTTLILCLNKQK